ncbi:MAG: pyridoxamine 5'-phosphate oxidase family protein [Caulobacterales bacterium]
MSNNDDIETVWKIVDKVRVAMVVTRRENELEGRPLHAYPDRDAHRIFFMTDSEHVIGEVNSDGRVLLSFSDPSGNNFAAIDGEGVVKNDRHKIKDLWTPWAEAFWKTPDNPAIRIIEVVPHGARYWDAPGKLATTLSMIAGAILGKQPNPGDSGNVRMT